MTAVEEDRFIAAADLVRFWLGRVLVGAEILGPDMDAPVRLRTDLTAVELTSVKRFLDRYDEERVR